jgi:hypothetical protein
MKVVRRVMLFAALPLALVLAAGYGWYEWSDTGKRWRYEDKLASYCDGLIPYAESAVFTGLDTEVSLSRDEQMGFGDDSYHSCQVADTTVAIGMIADDAVGSSAQDDMFDVLYSSTSDSLPVALGGGWQGYTDFQDVGVVLPCENKPASLVVAIDSDASHANPTAAREAGELATATARKAADHWSCEAEFGGRVPKVATPTGQLGPGSATGTCEGVDLHDNLDVDWLQETKPSSTAPLEMCVLGETGERDEVLYYMEATFGPYAQGLRSATDEPFSINTNSGFARDRAWATASCPGTPARAIFRIWTTEYAYPTKDFLLPSLRAFAERSTARRGCTDLKLPS